MRLLPKSIHRCRRYPTKFNSGRDIPTNFEYFKNQTRDCGNRDERERFNRFKPFILSVGKLKKRKGYDVSIEVYGRLLKKFPDLDYVIIGRGDGKYFEKLKELTVSLGVSRRVHFLRDVPDEELVKFYENAEVFILLPQNNEYDVEGFGLVFLEAAAFSLPVVGARDSGAEDAVIDGENGYLVAHDDVEVAAQRIIRILEDRDVNRRLSEASLAFAKRMTWDAVAEKYKKLYDSL